MCKLKKYHNTSNTRIDKCIETFIFQLKTFLKLKVLASCCGHGKYPMTIVVANSSGKTFDLFSGKWILKQRNFYKKDKQGYYFIPETID